MKLRLVGGAAMLLCVLLFQPGAETPLQRLWLPLLMGVSAALLLRNVLAVLVTGALLGLIRMNLAGDWISAQAYPLVGGICAVAAAWILARRYHRYMQDTRAARTARRQENNNHQQDVSDP